MAGSNRSRTDSASSAVARTVAPATRPPMAQPTSQTDARPRFFERRAVPGGLREVMDIRLAAEYLGISADSLYKYASDGLIPAFKLGNRWRFKRSLLEIWMEEQSSLSVAPAREKSIKPKQKKPVSRAR